MDRGEISNNINNLYFWTVITVHKSRSNLHQDDAEELRISEIRKYMASLQPMVARKAHLGRRIRFCKVIRNAQIPRSKIVLKIYANYRGTVPKQQS